MVQELSRKEYDLLVALEETREALSQRQLATKTGYSLSMVNRVLKELAQKQYVTDGRITEEGVEALEPYRVKKAVFVAAGFGARLVPVTLNTPKPLVRVNGERLIDSLIDAVLAVGIEDILIVRGYLGEQFDQLLVKYPMIRFAENPLYSEANNIASAVAVCDELENAYVCEADLLIRNPHILRKYHYCSDFLAFPVERTDDWCFGVKDGVITEEKVGGVNCHQMVGISYWSAADGRKLAKHLREAYELPGGKEYYWEQVPLTVFHEDYHVEVLPCEAGDVIEIDTYRELKAIDPAYNV